MLKHRRALVALTGIVAVSLGPWQAAAEPASQAPEAAIRVSNNIDARAANEAIDARIAERVLSAVGALQPPKRIKGERKGQAERRIASEKALKAFYEMREGKALWVGARGLNDRARMLLDVTSDADSWGLDPKAFAFDAAGSTDASDLDHLARNELALSRIALRYASHARGGRITPSDLSFDIFVEPPLADPASVLTDIMVETDLRKYLTGLHPSHKQFRLLQLAYLKLRDGGDAADIDAETVDAAPKKKSKKKQRKPKRLSRAEKLKRIKLTMEMWRWMPEDLGDIHVMANIPAYRVRVMDGDTTAFEERVIVGKFKTQTPLFSDRMEHIVFRPTWGVPNSIKVRELLPGLLRGGDPVSRKGLRLQVRGRDVNPRSVNWRRADIRNYTVYQPSGPRNALGNVKFMFPNSHAIYMHDTPTKHLFKRSTRTFSHGCVRVRNPQNFAKVLLRIANGWDEEQTMATYRRGPDRQQVNFDQPIPVHIGYFTVWADPETEKLTFFKDIYRHERHLAYALDGRYNKIRKVRRSVSADFQTIRASVKRREQAVTWFGSGTSGGGNKDWMKNVFNSD
ncbi:MAG: L,D-transpeptidase family protein [Pseudomonadota bacterium]